MKIGNVDLGEKPIVLAPMEDVTDLPFRLLCHEFGAAMVYTEFVSAEALVRDIPSTMRKLTIDSRERPVAIQIYGREPEDMVNAAKIVEQAGPDIIDINFGCPVKRVASKGAGAGMLRDIPKMLKITEGVVKAVSLPVTVKTRLGWDCENKIITDLAPRLQDCGIAALTIHGRTRSQMYTGSADWSMIREVKENPAIHIPIIGNGNITTPQQAKEAFSNFGVDAIMVGRAAFGAPWIFSQMTAAVKGEEIPELSPAEKFRILKRQVSESIEKVCDEYRGILHIRRHLAATPLLKGLFDFRPMRIAMLRADSKEDLFNLLDEIELKYFKP